MQSGRRNPAEEIRPRHTRRASILVMREAVFFYDFSSPYSYFSVHRVDDVLPVRPRWQPILFGALIAAIGKEPWSLRKGPSRDAQMRECEERAAQLGLPLQWPRDWPLGTYSILAGRAALVAEEQGRLREFSRAAFHQGLGRGRDLTDLSVVLEAAAEAMLDPVAVAEGVETARIKDHLRRATEDAVEIGVTGVPTVMIDGNLFWGDDRLDEAAQSLRSRSHLSL
jgi:2-hydroxychromene-2-carboxylate isomerase